MAVGKASTHHGIQGVSSSDSSGEPMAVGKASTHHGFLGVSSSVSSRGPMAVGKASTHHGIQGFLLGHNIHRDHIYIGVIFVS